MRLLVIGIAASSVVGHSSPDTAALDRLVIVSNAVCTAPSDYGYSANGEAGATFNAKVPKLLGKLFAAGLSASLSGAAETHKGIAQKDAGTVASDRLVCAEHVFIHLVDHFALTDLATGTKVEKPTNPDRSYRARAAAVGAKAATDSTVSVGQNSGFAGINEGTVNITTTSQGPAYDHKEQVVALAQFVKEANQIANTWANTDDIPRIRTEYASWYSRVDAYLTAQFDPSYSAQFEAAGSDSMMLVNHSIDGNGVWAAVRGKIKVLTEMLTELRRATR